MNRAERIQRIDYLVREESDLGSFTAERMEFSELLFTELQLVLNEVHGMNASLRFWKLIVEDHLLAEVLRKDNLRDTNWTGNPEWYAVVNFSNYPTFKEKIRNLGGHLIRSLKTRKVKAEINRLLQKKSEIYIGFNGLPVPEVNNNAAIFARSYPFIFGNGDSKKREILNKIAEKYTSQFLRNIIRRIPKIYIENFNKLYNSVELYEPERKTFHVHLTDSLSETMMIAKYSEEGAKLVWYQHGCYYGEVVHKYRGYFEHSTGDQFRTWGYKEHPIDEPWSAYRLEVFRQKLPQNAEEPTYDLMLCYAAMDERNKNRFIRNTGYLLDELDSVKYKKILARPRPVNSRVSASDQFSFISDARVVVAPDGSSIARQVSKSRIVLQMRVPSTNFLECIYCDHPVIGLLDNDQPTEIVTPFYEHFLKRGLLHRDMESAVQFLNEVNLENWWTEITQSREYQAYKQTFTNSDQFKETIVR
ncbi:hypothetical protein [Rhodohalobacter barkolensis]|uniref:Uncharacterized protein n=1 Tax=Rhodohalobacter barkolensis TaxID=2053187 RepID=A0A2N0VGH2_9BACT|nr:hypothetical protein [Rhodohalobacter barkolensis]PKD43270.1 hypothetical protein CWD77_11690 [Rhodohalobacter barkolensis]